MALAIPGFVAGAANIEVHAALTADSLELGKEYHFEVTMELAGLSAGKAGIPHPFLQIDVPKSARLKGKVIDDMKSLRRNEFLREPYERLMKENPQQIAFKIIRQPGADDAFYVNVIGYLAGDDGQTEFSRRRLKLPLVPGAKATAVDPSDSNWGRDRSLQIGDKAKNFKLPSAAGEKVSLKQFRGDKNVVVTTYRAHW
ncbi:MAG: hypothetical protein ACE5E5_12020 [Phycisphaerae bacterium]